MKITRETLQRAFEASQRETIERVQDKKRRFEQALAAVPEAHRDNPEVRRILATGFALEPMHPTRARELQAELDAAISDGAADASS